MQRRRRRYNKHIYPILSYPMNPINWDHGQCTTYASNSPAWSFRDLIGYVPGPEHNFEYRRLALYTWLWTVWGQGFLQAAAPQETMKPQPSCLQG